MRILVADDDPVTRVTLASLLGKRGYDVIAVDNGDMAYAILLDDDAPPLAILDWMMPGRDGVEVCRELRRLGKTSYTYVVMLTGMSKREDYLKAIQAGVDAFLPKPLDAVMLEAQINIATRILGLQAHTRQLESMMTVCSHCKRVKDKGHWVGLDEYVHEHYQVKQSHGYCPTCFEEKVAPELRELGIPTEGLKYP